jgi:hypothetical protein
MKRLFASFIFILLAVSLVPLTSSAQEGANPTGTVVYALPNTAINFYVEAEKETFIAGPYAQFAQKYLGESARSENAVSYTLKKIDVTPYIEADASSRQVVTIPERGSANFLKFCAQGLVVMSDSYTGKGESWRFPSIADNDQFAGKGVGGNLTSATTTLYKTVKGEGGFQKVAVQQSQVVEKSLEKKAAEAAQSIFDLRRSRVQIITGDTDATFSGEALSAAVEEINRLEQEYLSLFYGISETSIQSMNFDVVPGSDPSKNMYVAFRISDTQGLLPAGNMAGRPIVLELDIDKAGSLNTDVSGGRGKVIYYRVPAIATARVLDGQTMLMQTRIPVYQLGQTLSFPIETMTTK